LGVVNDRDLVQDELHDLFLDLHKYCHNLGEVENVAGYLCTCLKRKLYKKNNFQTIYLEPNWEGKLKHIPKELKLTQSHEDKIIDQDFELEQSNLLNRYLANLTEHQMRLLKMRFSEEKTYDEIADELSISVESTRTLLYRTLRTLRKSMISIFL